MQIKEIIAKAGSISNYFGYIILLFAWNLTNHVYTMYQAEISEPVIDFIFTWGLPLVLVPIIFAGVFGGIHEQQETQDGFERNGFFGNAIMHFWRFIIANFLSIIFYYTITLIVVLTSGINLDETDGNMVLPRVIFTLIAMINLVWFSGIVVERKIFLGLGRAIKSLLYNPYILAAGLLWAALGFADDYFFDLKGEQIPLVVNIARAAFFAVLRVLTTMFVLAVYKALWGYTPQKAQIEGALEASAADKPGEKLANASLGFTFVSFVPLLHLVALILGFLALKRSRHFILKAATACCVGGFFTIIYLLALAGMLAGRANDAPMPGYAFLADGNAELNPYVDLLNQGDVYTVQAQLDSAAESASDRHWAYDSALALAEYNDSRLDDALQDFYTALQKNPERSEFYFYYGLALLDNDKEDMALKQFQLALEQEPKLEIAQQYIQLIENTYRPTLIESVLMSIIVLVILFALHEYGHAYSAWKLGDDTAKNLGRVTLNPIAHLDIFGSILLPGILLLQQSGTLFGWAKPVPVNTENFKNPKKDDMVVSFAGPAVNLLISMMCVVILGLILLFIRLLWPESISLHMADPSTPVSIVGPPLPIIILVIITFIKQMFYTSLILGFFNLLPVPPLDGSWILSGALPEGARAVFEKMRQFSFVFFILLMMTPVLDYFLGIPVGLAWLGLQALISMIGLA